MGKKAIKTRSKKRKREMITIFFKKEERKSDYKMGQLHSRTKKTIKFGIHIVFLIWRGHFRRLFFPDISALDISVSGVSNLSES